MRWVAGAESDTLWRRWDDDEIVVYHVPSGETHLLNVATAAVLRACRDRPADRDAVLERLSTEFDPADVATIEPHVDALLEHLDALGLIAPADRP